MDETLPITSSDDSAIKASRSTDIHVGVTADTVQDNARVTGIAVGAIQGPVTINVTGPAVDLAAIRRAAAQALLQPVLDLRDFEPVTIPIPGGPFPLGRADVAIFFGRNRDIRRQYERITAPVRRCRPRSRSCSARCGARQRRHTSAQALAHNRRKSYTCSRLVRFLR